MIIFYNSYVNKFCIIFKFEVMNCLFSYLNEKCGLFNSEKIEIFKYYILKNYGNK